jgi:hypothetical protein
MRTLSIRVILLLSIALFVGCQKEGSLENGILPSGNEDITVQLTPDGQLDFGPDVAGLLNAGRTRYFSRSFSGVIDADSTDFDAHAVGWFGSSANTLDAGIVKVGDSMLTIMPNIIRPGNHYGNIDIDPNVLFTASNLITWTVQGNNASGVAGFTYTDNGPIGKYPVVFVPDSIPVNTGVTLSHTLPEIPALLTHYTLLSTTGHISKMAQGNEASVSFSSAELSTIASIPNDYVNINVTRAWATSKFINGKKYIFLKASQIHKGRYLK